MPKPNSEIIINNKIQWNTVYKLLNYLKSYNFYKACDGFMNKDLNIKTVDELEKINKKKIIN